MCVKLWLQIEREKADLSVQVITLVERLEEAEGGVESQVSLIEELTSLLSASDVTRLINCVAVWDQQEARHRAYEAAQVAGGCAHRERRDRRPSQAQAPWNRQRLPGADRPAHKGQDQVNKLPFH